MSLLAFLAVLAAVLIASFTRGVSSSEMKEFGSLLPSFVPGRNPLAIFTKASWFALLVTY